MYKRGIRSYFYLFARPLSTVVVKTAGVGGCFLKRKLGKAHGLEVRCK